MRKGQGHIRGIQTGCEFGCFAVKPNCWTATRRAPYLNVTPPHSAAPACAQRFHGGLFCGEPCSEPLDSIRFRVAVANFLVREDAAQKPFAELLDRFGYPWHFCDIDSGANDHEGLR